MELCESGRVTMTGDVRIADDSPSRTTIVEHAARCFERYGVHRTRMADIADGAGISRQALYRMFPNRQSVLDAVVQQHVDDFVVKLQPILLACDTFAEELVETGVQVIRIVRETPDLLDLSLEPAGQASRFLLRPGTVAGKLSQGVWQPVIDRGRERGEVRADLVDQDFIEWVSTTMLMYGLREDIPLDQIRVLLRSFLVPAATG
jgi:AcrR family transcriptional regulator